MNKLMLEEKYVQVVELFENYLQHVYKMEEFKNVKSERKADNPIKFMFPNDQFDLVTMALLKMVTLFFILKKMCNNLQYNDWYIQYNDFFMTNKFFLFST